MAVETTVVETMTDEERTAAAAAATAESAAAATALAAGAAAAAELDAGERIRRFEEENTTWRATHAQELAAARAELAETRATLGSLASLVETRLTPPIIPVTEPVAVTVVEPPTTEDPPNDNADAPREPPTKRSGRRFV